MSENTKVWEALSTPPKAALKEIKGGRMKGMTDINPTWRMLAMTKQFGICGIGWKYEITNMRERACKDELMCFVEVNLYVKVNGEWSDAIPGTGGSSLAKNERNGLYVTDEGYKMALTDALSVAMKAIGVASDIYMTFEASKYIKWSENQGDS
jgi:hypothetical protein